MVPKLYESTETAFISEGLGRLPNATRCEVTEERNGIYELVLEYPVIPGDEMLNNIQVGCYIGATHDDDQDIQPFQIYKVSAPIRGVVTVNAWHISYALNYIPVMPFTANSCADVLSGIPTNSMKTNPFTFWTDKTTTGEFIMKQPMAARALLGGTQGSVLDVYGSGEYEFDKYNVKLWTNRGADNGVEIRYGKNLVALDYVLNGADVFNAVAPFWTNDATTVYLDHLVVKSGETAQNAIPLDLSSEFETEPTSAQLEAAAQAYIDASGNYSLKENITVDFYPVWQTEEYNEDERVKLCDTVTVIFGGYNIKAKAKVVKVIYDTLRDRYKSIELGSPKTTFAQEITQIVSDNIMGDVGSLVKRTAADAIPDASTTERGLVSTGDQTFAGKKTFNNRIIANASSTGDGATGSIVAQGGNPSIVSYNTALNKYIELAAGSSGNRGLYTGDGWVLYLGGDGKLHFGKPVDATNLPVASATQAGIVSTEGQTFAGAKTFNSPVTATNNVQIKTSGAYAQYGFRNAGSSATTGFMEEEVSATGNRIYFTQYGRTDGTTDAYKESFFLPQTNSRTSNANYKIITTKNIGDIPDADASTRGLVSTGAQTFAGAKTFTSSPKVSTSGSYADVTLSVSSDSASVEYHGYKANYGGRAYINQTSGKSDGTGKTGYYERYFFPTPDANRTSNADYSILTTKTIYTKSDTSSISGVQLRRWGNIVTIFLRGASVNSSGSIGTIPADYRPSAYLYANCVHTAAGNVVRPAQITIEASGTTVISAYNGSNNYGKATNGYVNGTITFVVN